MYSLTMQRETAQKPHYIRIILDEILKFVKWDTWWLWHCGRLTGYFIAAAAGHLSPDTSWSEAHLHLSEGRGSTEDKEGEDEAGGAR